MGWAPFLAPRPLPPSLQDHSSCGQTEPRDPRFLPWYLRIQLSMHKMVPRPSLLPSLSFPQAGILPKPPFLPPKLPFPRGWLQDSACLWCWVPAPRPCQPQLWGHCPGFGKSLLPGCLVGLVLPKPADLGPGLSPEEPSGCWGGEGMVGSVFGFPVGPVPA